MRLVAEPFHNQALAVKRRLRHFQPYDDNTSNNTAEDALKCN